MSIHIFRVGETLTLGDVYRHLADPQAGNYSHYGFPLYADLSGQDYRELPDFGRSVYPLLHLEPYVGRIVCSKRYSVPSGSVEIATGNFAQLREQKFYQHLPEELKVEVCPSERGEVIRLVTKELYVANLNARQADNRPWALSISTEKFQPKLTTEAQKTLMVLGDYTPIVWSLGWNMSPNFYITDRAPFVPEALRPSQLFDRPEEMFAYRFATEAERFQDMAGSGWRVRSQTKYPAVQFSIYDSGDFLWNNLLLGLTLVGTVPSKPSQSSSPRNLILAYPGAEVALQQFAQEAHRDWGDRQITRFGEWSYYVSGLE